MFDIRNLILVAGYPGLFLIVFAESGFLFGFFLPGDSLLFTAGLLSSIAEFGLNIWIIAPLCAAAAILGDSFGYFCGRKFGPRLFNREDSLLFHKKHIEKTKQFYEKYGKKTIILARFVPIVRTFAPIFAGVGQMNYSVFLSYNVIGGLVWGGGMPLLGYFLGSAFPWVEEYMLVVIGGIILISFVPIIREFFVQNSSGHVSQEGAEK